MVMVMVRAIESSNLSGSRALQLLGKAGKVLALVEGLGELELGGLPRPVSSKSPGSVRAPSLELLYLKHPSPERVPDRHEDHAVVSQLGYCCQPAYMDWKRQIEDYELDSATRTEGCRRVFSEPDRSEKCRTGL